MSVDIQNLTKRFSLNGAPAVADVTLSAPTGEITALLGPSGVGKSTVLRLIAGLEVPDKGTIAIEGTDCSSRSVRERAIGFVFQSYALFQNMTVRENIAFGLRVRKAPRQEIDARVDELVDLVQLKELGRRYPAQLSGGQRQRVALARALAVRPKVLLLDEPFGALDAQVRAELREWLQRFHAETHVTTIIVTHDQTEALEVSQHIVVMQEGRVVQAGPPREVYDHPATPFVAAFLGGANVLKGLVKSGRAELGSLVVPGRHQGEEGAEIHAFVRPHDVKLSKATDDQARAVDGAPSVSIGRIDRFKHIGGQVKVTLGLPSGETVTVEMPAADFESLRVAVGDRVYVDVRSAKVFVGDYSI